MYTPDLPPHKKIPLQKKPGILQLIPFFVFIGFFLLLHIAYLNVDPSLKAGFALTASILAIFVAAITFIEDHTLNEKVQIFINGTRRPTITYMCYIFIFSSVFTHIVSKIGGVQAAIQLGFRLISPEYILPGLFAIISIFAFTIGSSIGSIIAFMPIAVGFSKTLGINPSLIAGIVVSGSMLGDNLSLISDTTIAASKTAGCKVREKFIDNLWLVVPAFFLTLTTLFFISKMLTIPTEIILPTASLAEVIKIIPYGIVFILAISGFDVLAVLLAGAITATIIGVLAQSFSLLEASSFIFEGFYSQPGMISVFMLIMFISGLAKMVEYNGGIDYLLQSSEHLVTSKRRAEAAIAFLAAAVTAAIVSNTVAILISGPVAKKIGTSFSIRPARVVNLLDIFACFCYGILPYAPPLLLAGAMAHVSSISLLPHLHYQFIIGSIALFSIVKSNKKKPVSSH